MARLNVKVQLNAHAHPTDRLIVCEKCGESYAGFSTPAEAADWAAEHLRRKHMTCVCDFDEHNWPIIHPACPIHNRPKTFSERLHTWWERLWTTR